MKSGIRLIILCGLLVCFCSVGIIFSPKIEAYSGGFNCSSAANCRASCGDMEEDPVGGWDANTSWYARKTNSAWFACKQYFEVEGEKGIQRGSLWISDHAPDGTFDGSPISYNIGSQISINKNDLNNGTKTVYLQGAWFGSTADVPATYIKIVKKNNTIWGTAEDEAAYDAFEGVPDTMIRYGQVSMWNNVIVSYTKPITLNVSKFIDRELSSGTCSRSNGTDIVCTVTLQVFRCPSGAAPYSGSEQCYSDTTKLNVNITGNEYTGKVAALGTSTDRSSDSYGIDNNGWNSWYDQSRLWREDTGWTSHSTLPFNSPVNHTIEDCPSTGCYAQFGHRLWSEASKNGFAYYNIKKEVWSASGYTESYLAGGNGVYTGADFGNNKMIFVKRDSVKLLPGEKVCETLTFFADGKGTQEAKACIETQPKDNEYAGKVAALGTSTDRSSDSYGINANEWGRWYDQDRLWRIDTNWSSHSTLPFNSPVSHTIEDCPFTGCYAQFGHRLWSEISTNGHTLYSIKKEVWSKSGKTESYLAGSDVSYADANFGDNKMIFVKRDSAKLLPGEKVCETLTFFIDSKGMQEAKACIEAESNLGFEGRSNVWSKEIEYSDAEGEGQIDITTGWTSAGSREVKHFIEDCDDGCTARLAHYLRRSSGGGTTQYDVSSPVTNGWDAESRQTESVTATAALFSEGYVRVRRNTYTMYPGEEVCETLNFSSMGDGTKDGHATVCAVALGTTRSSISMKAKNNSLRTRDSGSQYTQYVDEIFIKPGDEVGLQATYNALRTYVPNIKPDIVKIDGGDSSNNSGRNNTLKGIFNDKFEPDWMKGFVAFGSDAGYGGSYQAFIGDGSKYTTVSTAGFKAGTTIVKTAKTNPKDTNTGEAIYKNVWTTPEKVKFDRSGNNIMSDVGTGSISDDAFIKVPYNFTNSICILGEGSNVCQNNDNTPVAYAGENKTVRYKITVGNRTNALLADTYATNVVGARMRIDVCYSGLCKRVVDKSGVDFDKGGVNSSIPVGVPDLPAGTDVTITAMVYPRESFINSAMEPSEWEDECSPGDDSCWGTSSVTYKIAKRPNFQVWGGNVSANSITASVATKTSLAGHYSSDNAVSNWKEMVPDDMEELRLKRVHVGNECNNNVNATQSLAIGDDYLFVVQPGKNSSTAGCILGTKFANLDPSGGTKPDLEISNIKVGHGNGATWNSATHQIVITDDDRYLFNMKNKTSFDCDNYTNGRCSRVTGVSGATGIAYKGDGEYVETSGRGNESGRIVDGNFKNPKVKFDAGHKFANQDVGYYNGHIYRIGWAGCEYMSENNVGDPDFCDDYFGQIGDHGTLNVIYQFSMSGEFEKAFIIREPRGELESIDFKDGKMYLLFNNMGSNDAYSMTQYAVFEATNIDFLHNGFSRFGSWAELAVVKGEKNDSMASGAGLGYAGYKDGKLWPNQSPTDGLGNNPSKSGDYIGEPGGRRDDNYEKLTLDGGGGVNIDLSAVKESLEADGYVESDSDSENKRLYYSDDTFTVSSDIKNVEDRSQKEFSTFAEVPKIVILANHINIECGVKRVDAILIARESINTCSNPGGGNAKKAQNAQTQLVINGAIKVGYKKNNGEMLGTLELNRTYGASTGNNSMVPAEIINYDNSMLFVGGSGGGNVSVDPNKFEVQHVRELAPRY